MIEVIIGDAANKIPLCQESMPENNESAVSRLP